ncbi:MAG: hypothetical protein QOI27_2910 [Gaiellaceae bacterium]|jgi:hypothetical protein|nr:hypothetical protein [Gaiellaceae bacterium]MDX6468562.1 hypothetical protein [Gaiellaceae bacterium]
MSSLISDPESATGTMPMPPPLPKLLPGEKRLDATLLEIVRRRKQTDVLPGVPFH